MLLRTLTGIFKIRSLYNYYDPYILRDYLDTNPLFKSNLDKKLCLDFSRSLATLEEIPWETVETLFSNCDEWISKS